MLPVDWTVSSKQKNSPKRPWKTFYDITFNSDVTGFNYIIFQNFYVFTITVKQYKGEDDSRAEMDKPENWKTVLANYKLMKNAHFEGDAQNWHIIGTELFNDKFDTNCLSTLRIYMNSPSPSWLDFSLKNISVYYKKKALKEDIKAGKKTPASKGEKTVLEYDQTMNVTDEVRKIAMYSSDQS